MHTHQPARRHFLKLSTRLATLGLTGLGLGPSRSWFVTDAEAAPVSDYKALVCVYLFGGNDCNNTLVPLDNARYTQYQSIRASLTLSAAQLTTPIADAGGNPFGLHLSLNPIHSLFGAGRMAVVLNTGQLERPLTRQQYQQGLLAPSNLFSHSDQTIQAQTATSNNTIGGWGGRLLDAFGAGDTLAAVSVSSPAPWLQSGGGAPNVIPPGASLNLSGMNIWPSSAAQARRQAVDEMLALDNGHPLRSAANDAFADGLQLAASLNAIGSVGNLQTVFPGTNLGNQMREVLRLIRLRSQIGPGRQVFFCSMGGYDTHTSQSGTHNTLLAEMAGALKAFYDATLEVGLSQQVTTFTQSEFGRTLQPNGSGTDHAWGGHQFVIGGAVRGGIYGQFPTLALSGPDDANNRGVWIPTISTAQFGATLGKWFGASPGELAVAFPNLAQFATPDVGFMV
jgi:uncharacterized protein (DUF1501 family)